LYNSTIYDELFDVVKTKYVAKIYNFADPLKQDICMNILGLTHDQCYGDDTSKNSLTSIRWEDMPGYNISWTYSKDYHPSGFMTARQIMQHIGTDIFRKLKNDVWSHATINKIQNEKPALAIIADCRFPNEVDAVKSVGGIVIKLMRNPYNSDHESELALDEIVYDHNNFDLVINNETLSIDDQNSLIQNFLITKKVLS
jgi:hypothetical protein